MTADMEVQISKEFNKLYNSLLKARDESGNEDYERIEDCLGLVAHAKAIWDGESEPLGSDD